MRAPLLAHWKINSFKKNLGGIYFLTSVLLLEQGAENIPIVYISADHANLVDSRTQSIR